MKTRPEIDIIGEVWQECLGMCEDRPSGNDKRGKTQEVPSISNWQCMRAWEEVARQDLVTNQGYTLWYRSCHTNNDQLKFDSSSVLKRQVGSFEIGNDTTSDILRQQIDPTKPGQSSAGFFVFSKF